MMTRGTPEGDKVTGESLERDRSIGFLTLEIQSCAGTVGTGWGAMGGTVGSSRCLRAAGTRARRNGRGREKRGGGKGIGRRGFRGRVATRGKRRKMERFWGSGRGGGRRGLPSGEAGFRGEAIAIVNQGRMDQKMMDQQLATTRHCEYAHADDFTHARPKLLWKNLLEDAEMNSAGKKIEEKFTGEPGGIFCAVYNSYS
ncbi:hypothetical protein DY000_02032395 [Brassica cretica]|uniref:Uncharacterized protein n=1 Tax=Brassica cretica TaxID=69181 RepID=A0ABQ7DVY0_BRACR|nr:hypothetical protein DY000_02032395 [Brassica cretica]